MAITTFAGRKVLITGAASGIGRATAVAAAREGAQLVLTDVQDVALEKTAREIEASGGTVLARRAFDISDHDAVVAFADAVHDAHGSLDVVMNIAGIATWGTIDRLTHEDWRRTVDINLMGPISVMEAFVPPMIDAGRGGHVVNVSSAAGLFGLPWHAPYSAAKFGLRGVSEVLRFDLRRHGIGVSLVCPGGVKTPLVGTVRIAGVDRDSPDVKKFTSRFERHAVSPEHVAQCILTGIRKDRYMVYTSPDIRWGHFFTRKWELPYVLLMRVANNQFFSVTRSAMLPRTSRTARPSPPAASRGRDAR
ncbi:MAG: SDR family oxidoreductase [Solirubrobacteraceae bacterium]|nr:SDR family oxidoreductase [Solirubrobacteraceae bacterium]